MENEILIRTYNGVIDLGEENHSHRNIFFEGSSSPKLMTSIFKMEKMFLKDDNDINLCITIY